MLYSYTHMATVGVKRVDSLVAVVGDDKVPRGASDAVVVLEQSKLTSRRRAAHQ